MDASQAMVDTTASQLAQEDLSENVTVAPAAKFVPVIVTAVPPAVDPLFGDTLLTVGITT